MMSGLEHSPVRGSSALRHKSVWPFIESDACGSQSSTSPSSNTNGTHFEVALSEELSLDIWRRVVDSTRAVVEHLHEEVVSGALSFGRAVEEGLEEVPQFPPLVGGRYHSIVSTRHTVEHTHSSRRSISLIVMSAMSSVGVSVVFFIVRYVWVTSRRFCGSR